MKLSIALTALVGSLLCISPIFGQENSTNISNVSNVTNVTNVSNISNISNVSNPDPNPDPNNNNKKIFLGDFKTHVSNRNRISGTLHNVGGKIYSKGDNQLVIEGFTYDGRGDEPFFWTGINSSEPNYPDGILLSHPFNGMIQN